MPPFVRKFYSLPGVWSFFTVPVLASNFMLKDLQKQERPRRGYLLYLTLCFTELAALAAWYAFYFSGHAESAGSYVAGGLFLLSALILIVVSQLYARRHKIGFCEFLIEQGYAAYRPELLTTSKQ